MKFAMSYSCGKDSTLALHKMVVQGHEPVCLVVMVKEAEGRSYFHGADDGMLDQYEQALGLPMIRCPANGETYHTAFEDGLRRAKEMGAQAACFGDIDIEQNRSWEEDRCRAAGLLPYFPLWQRGREECVRELVSLGYQCLIKSICQAVLPKDILGKYINVDTISVFKTAGIDVCGENGEYHTLTVNGPMFRKPLAFQTGDILEFGEYAAVEIK